MGVVLLDAEASLPAVPTGAGSITQEDWQSTASSARIDSVFRSSSSNILVMFVFIAAHQRHSVRRRIVAEEPEYCGHGNFIHARRMGGNSELSTLCFIFLEGRMQHGRKRVSIQDAWLLTHIESSAKK